MMTFSPNLKKCLILSLSTLLSWQAYAASTLQIESQIRRDLVAFQSMSFDFLLKKWTERYQVSAVPALLRLSADPTLQDTQRYIALMGSAKLGGEKTLPEIAKSLQDPSWMLRSGALRILAASGKPNWSEKALPFLQDSALVVRSEALSTITKVPPKGTEAALIRALQDPSNYHGGKAQWVPHKILSILIEMRVSKPNLNRLRALLASRFAKRDLRFQSELKRAIRKLSS